MSESLVVSTPRRLGADGPEVGPLAFGMWRFVGPDVDRNADLLEAALDQGLDLVDTADVYGLDHGGTGFGACEAALGRVLAARPHLRDRMILATKGGIVPPVPYDSSPDWIRKACDDSLRRIGVDRIDLYQIHRPDIFTHPAVLAETLAGLVAAGKVGAVGVSNHTVAQTEALRAHLVEHDLDLVSTQPEFSALSLGPLRDGTLDLCTREGLIPLAWSPLAGGRLATGEGAPGDLIDVLDRLAEREGTDRGTVALAFVLCHPAAPVAIIGTQRPERIAAAVGALDVTLDRNDVYDIIEASDGEPLP